jgi:hypothetical protein
MKLCDTALEKKTLLLCVAVAWLYVTQRHFLTFSFPFRKKTKIFRQNKNFLADRLYFFSQQLQSLKNMINSSHQVKSSATTTKKMIGNILTTSI